MKKMKKIICLFLCMFFCAANAAVFAADDSDNKYAAEAEMMEFLQELELIPDYRTIDMSNQVTRADFADAVAKIIKADSYTAEKSYFYDVPVSHWAYESICSLAERNVIFGNGEKLFHPDEMIKTTDAYAIILSAMGYNDYAMWNGGYPEGYIKTAQELKISKGVKSGEILKYKDMFRLLYQSISTGICREEFTTGSGKSYMQSEKTLLSVYFDIYKDEGVVTGVNGFSTENGSLKKDCVEIDGTVYLAGGDFSEFLGQDTEYFYRERSNDAQGTVVWLKKSGKSKVLEIEVNDDAVFDSVDFSLRYNSDGRGKTVVLPRNMVFIYNGNIVNENIGKYLSEPYYDLKLIAENGDDYDIAVISQYENITAGSVDLYQNRVYDKKDGSLYIELDEDKYTYLNITNKSGEKLTLEEIEAGDVLSVYKSADGQYADIRVSGSRIKGSVVGADTEETGFSIMLDDQKAYFYRTAETKCPVSINDEVELYLDIKDRVAYIAYSLNEMRAAYLMEVYENNEEEFLKLKLLDSDNSIKKLICAEKLRVDGKKYSDVNKQLAALSGDDGIVIKQLILIKEEDGKITEIDTPAVKNGEGVNTLQVNVPRQKAYWRAINHGGNMPINGSTKIFLIPENVNSATDDDYMIVTNSQTPSDRAGTYATSYKTTEEVGFEQYVVMEYTMRSQSPSGVPVIVTKNIKTIDGDGQIVDQISGYQGKKSVRLQGDGTTNLGDIKPGTLIWVSLDPQGKICQTTKLVTLADVESKAGYNNGFNALSSYVYGTSRGVVDGVVKIDCTGDSAYDQAININGASIIVYDRSKKEDAVTVGGLSDIVHGNFVLVDTTWASGRTVYVYK